ncbi:hypothetical protein A2U01_0111639, partial [Trifolium medium]|nr:hypothetical protein [Trifolium medium]
EMCWGVFGVCSGTLGNPRGTALCATFGIFECGSEHRFCNSGASDEGEARN